MAETLELATKIARTRVHGHFTRCTIWTVHRCMLRCLNDRPSARHHGHHHLQVLPSSKHVTYLSETQKIASKRFAASPPSIPQSTQNPKKRGYVVIFGSLHLRVFRKGARTLGLMRQTQQTNHFPELPFNPPPLGLQNLDFKTLNRRTTI